MAEVYIIKNKKGQLHPAFIHECAVYEVAFTSILLGVVLSVDSLHLATFVAALSFEAAMHNRENNDPYIWKY